MLSPSRAGSGEHSLGRSPARPLSLVNAIGKLTRIENELGPQFRLDYCKPRDKFKLLVASPGEDKLLVLTEDTAAVLTLDKPRYQVIENGQVTAANFVLRKALCVVANKGNQLFLHSASNFRSRELVHEFEGRLLQLEPNYVRNLLLVVTERRASLLSLQNWRQTKLFQSKQRIASALFSEDKQSLFLSCDNGQIQEVTLQNMQTVKTCNLLQSHPLLLVGGGSKSLAAYFPQSENLFLWKSGQLQNYRVFSLQERVLRIHLYSSEYLFVLFSNDRLFVFSISTFHVREVLSAESIAPIADFAISDSLGSLFLLGEKGRVQVVVFDSLQLQGRDGKAQERTLDQVQAPTRAWRIQGTVQVGQKNHLLEEIQNALPRKGKLSLETIKQFYARFGKLPRREYVWPSLLGLPENYVNYSLLQSQSKGEERLLNKVIKDLMVNSKQRRKLINVMKVLGTLCPQLLTLGPHLLGCYIEMFHSLFETEIGLFEFLVSLLSQWGFCFLDQRGYLGSYLKRVLATVEPELSSHFVQRFCVRLEDYLLDSYRVFMVDMMDEELWLQFMDLVLINFNQPEYYPLAVAAYLSLLKPIILPCGSIHQCHQEILLKRERRITGLQIQGVVKEYLAREDLSLPEFYTNRLPLSSSLYPRIHLSSLEDQNTNQEESYEQKLIAQIRNAQEIKHLEKTIQQLEQRVSGFQEERLLFFVDRHDQAIAQERAQAKEVIDRQRRENELRVAAIAEEEARNMDIILRDELLNTALLKKLDAKFREETHILDVAEQFNGEAALVRQLESDSLKRTIELLKEKILREERALEQESRAVEGIIAQQEKALAQTEEEVQQRTSKAFLEEAQRRQKLKNERLRLRRDSPRQPSDSSLK